MCPEVHHSADCVRDEPEVEGGESWTVGGDPTFIKGMDNDSIWTCICDHLVDHHTQSPPHDDLPCTLCDCPDFCKTEDADEVTDIIYEWALEDGERWAGTAHEYRRRRLQRKGRPDA